jgi:hypothetical protein
MIGNFDLPDTDQQRVWIYSNRTAPFLTWNKPPGINFVQIIAIGAGGGGGGGRANDDTALIYGGVGGSNGAYSVCFYPASLLPDIIYIQLGLGGTGGAGSGIGVNGGSGTNGGVTYVTWYPSITTSAYALLVALGGTGGVGGDTAGRGGAAAAAAVASTSIPISQIGNRVSLGGIASTGNSLPADITANYRTTPGTTGGRWGSGASTFAAASITYPAGDYVLQPVPGGGNNTGRSGTSLVSFDDLIFTGGTGGSVNRTGTAGNGGNGGPGCGGGGGAAGNVIGSNGGRGGDGLVIITCG